MCTRICFSIFALVVAFFAGRIFHAMQEAEPIVAGPGVTAQRMLSATEPSLAGGPGDTPVFELAGAPGGTMLLLGGTHPQEIGGAMAAILMVENARVKRGRLIVVPQANRSGFTHTDPMDYTVTNPGIEQLDIIEEEGGDPTKVIIGHAFVEPQSLQQIVDILKRGAYVQVDHIGIPWRHDDATQLDESMANMMCELADKGYLDQMVITYDRWFFNPRGAATAENPQLLNQKVGLGHLFDSFAPRLAKKGFGAAELDVLLVDNPRRILPF